MTLSFRCRRVRALVIQQMLKLSAAHLAISFSHARLGQDTVEFVHSQLTLSTARWERIRSGSFVSLLKNDVPTAQTRRRCCICSRHAILDGGGRPAALRESNDFGVWDYALDSKGWREQGEVKVKREGSIGLWFRSHLCPYAFSLPALDENHSRLRLPRRPFYRNWPMYPCRGGPSATSYTQDDARCKRGKHRSHNVVPQVGSNSHKTGCCVDGAKAIEHLRTSKA